MKQLFLAFFICLVLLSTTASCGTSDNDCYTIEEFHEFFSSHPIQYYEFEYSNLFEYDEADWDNDEVNNENSRTGWGDNEFDSIEDDSGNECPKCYDSSDSKLDYYSEKYPFNGKYLVMYFEDMNIDGTLVNVKLSGSIENVEIKGNLENIYKALVNNEKHLKSVVNRLASEGHICEVLGHDFINKSHLYSFPPGHKIKTFQSCNICGITRIIINE